MFRFDFKDKSLIPPIFGTDNADYLEQLCPVLERENIYPLGVVRLRDAAFCEERGDCTSVIISGTYGFAGK